MSDSGALEKRVVVRCTVERAFAVFTARIDSWWPPGHRRFESSVLAIEPRVGGRFVERSASGEESDLGEVRAWEPPRRVSYTWTPGSRTGTTEVEVTFTAQGEHTLVRVIHREGTSDSWGATLGRFERSWGVVLDALASAAERADEEGADR